jgi:hypothetical protein
MDLSIPECHLAYGEHREDHCLVPIDDYQFCPDIFHQLSETQITTYVIILNLHPPLFR